MPKPDEDLQARLPHRRASAIAPSQRTPAVPAERVEHAIVEARGQRVLLDEDLARLYGTETKLLTRAVRRNLERFPADFAFQLSREEWAALRIQTGTAKAGRGGRRSPPWAFTEEGVAMLSSVLRSPRAIQANIAIMRAFVRLRQLVASHEELARELQSLDRKTEVRFRAVFNAIRQLMERRSPVPERRRIGFRSDHVERV